MKPNPASLIAIATIVIWGAVSVPPVFAAAPQIVASVTLQHAAVEPGKSNTFKVIATGGSLSYQWQRDGNPVPFQTNQTLTIGPAQPGDEGDYSVEVRNADGAVVVAPVRLWVVPPASAFTKGNFTNATLRLPYFYNLPPDYNPARKYPLACIFHGVGGDETAMTSPNYGLAGYLNYPMFKTLSSLGRETTGQVIVVWPTRRAGDYMRWTTEYLQLVSGMLDRLISEFSIDTNRLYVAGGAEGVHAAWDLMGMRPGLFAGAILACSEQGSTPAVSLKDIPLWAFSARDDEFRAFVTMRELVHQLRVAGGSPIYTEYQSGGHLGASSMAMATPAALDWLLAQRRGLPSSAEPLLSVNASLGVGITTTGASSLDATGSAGALGQDITQVCWTNTVNNASGLADGTKLWTAANLPLAFEKTNVVIVTATTTSWAPAYGGNTTFSKTLLVASKPLRASITLQPPRAVLNWTGGVAPFRVQRASELATGDWIDVATNAAPPLAIDVDEPLAFYRIIGY